MSCCDEKRKKRRTPEEERALINRLKRIEGQVRGLSAMVEDEAYCVDILTQTAAVNSALTAFAKELLASHIKSCATEDIREGREGAADELIRVIERFMK